ncbi:MAG TPA: hypothetical protein VEK15_17600, partial [Vicinamibacteria bacterium]|nr:hypothetical protein [Vicinamibacteria bacterium]
LISGTSAMAEFWVFNAGLYRLLDAVAPAKPVVAVALLVIVGRRTWALRDRSALPNEALYVLGSLLILSPIVNAWYVLWILPFAVVTRNLPFLAFTHLVSFAYAWFHDPETAFTYRVVEYGIFYLLLLLCASSKVCGDRRLADRRPT